MGADHALALNGVTLRGSVYSVSKQNVVRDCQTKWVVKIVVTRSCIRTVYGELSVKEGFKRGLVSSLCFRAKKTVSLASRTAWLTG